ncbi:Gp138 family membrane-puncturing spike protein [Commensalibacter nepenthis]|uniref:Gp138 family membrane-puncturing spike protein n=1 Tax=Commensalibacter nepenthis TaxID=3043872 RepID=A0ABT6Q763_9PROT|nr:Gp138 family membrane-puncturing spike protein [Commensalibacter sp. TBRC 10068]MDI2112083.1 Gp138 family membrane-puncturing spike protein [Commensalibacter sp. TBRC 10068]
MINPNKGNSSLNTLVGIIDNALSSVSTAMPVTVLQVYENHTLDAMPMVDMLDNQGKSVKHAPITGIPYARLQGGDYGLIIEPKAGDKGLVVFASRDISDVVESKGKAKPASLRKHSMSDGMYIASLLYEEPKTFIKITGDTVEIEATNINIKGNVTIDKDATINGISFVGHTHLYDGKKTTPPQ